VVVSHEEVTEARPLPAETSAQKTELIALIRALTLGEEKWLDICTNSKYVFLVLHAHVAIWKERGLLSWRESPIKHGKEFLQLLETILLSKKVAVIHCREHQRELW
jgi:ribonuclease HI